MTRTTKNLEQKLIARCMRGILVAMCGVLVFTNVTDAASVAKRGPAPQAVPSRSGSTKAKTTATTTSTSQNTTSSATSTDTTSYDEEDFYIEDKSSQFDTIVDKASNTTGLATDSDLAKLIREQRDAFDSQDKAKAASTKSASSNSSCDNALRQCMQTKCGNDFTKCKTDGDTDWGNKLDACRRNTSCTGNEYKLFSIEIKADRDMNARLANYNKILECGNSYNECIINQCGVNYGKCLGKTAGDKAIADCAKIANNCKQQDSGLASRTMSVFGTLREGAEKQIATDEKKLYALRDKMADACRLLGAMFDERSFDCVYTVNFFAGESTHPQASRKAYAGSTFTCTPEWFGVDVTTYKENAYRETRAQTAASAAMLGSGLGSALGTITSGALNRAIDTNKAKKALEAAEREQNGGVTNSQINRHNNKILKANAKEATKLLKSGDLKNTLINSDTLRSLMNRQ